MANVHVDDVGTVFIIYMKLNGSPLDVSAATQKQIVLGRPDKTSVVKDAAFVSDGTDGGLKCSSAVGDLSLSGSWRIQGVCTIPAGTWHSDVSTFPVEANI